MKTNHSKTTVRTKFSAVLIMALTLLFAPITAQALTYEASNFDELQGAIIGYNSLMEDTVITVTANFDITGDLYIVNWNGNGAALTIRGDDPDVTLTRAVAGRLLRVNNGAKLILEDIIIDGNKGVYFNDSWSPLVDVPGGGALIMKDGAVLRNNNNTGYNGGAVFVSGEFTMTGGKIIGNTAGGGGGVSVFGNHVDNMYVPGEFTMTGGEISGNNARYDGGGVYVGGSIFSNGDGAIFSHSGTFTMTGGEISGNTAGIGGGVSVPLYYYINNGAYVSGNFTLGGDAVISGNTKNNVFIGNYDNQNNYITLSTTSPPGSGMKVGVQTGDWSDGVIVESGAYQYFARYFYADESGKAVSFEDNQLVIRDSQNLITASPSPIQFGAPRPPYAQPAERTVTITNTGTGTVTLTQPVAANYHIGQLSRTTLAPGAISTFTVRPKANLPVGNYSETIDIIGRDINGNDGISAKAAVRFAVLSAPVYKTVSNFAELQAAINEYRTATGDMFVSVSNSFYITDSLEIPIGGGALTIKRANAASPVVLTRDVVGSLFYVPFGAKLIFEDIIIDGDNAVYPEWFSPLVYVDGEFVMEAGAILRNNASSGGVYVWDGEFTMNGGYIHGNSSNYEFGGVYVGGNGGKFTMNSGSISGNSSNWGGGGVYVGGGTFTIGSERAIIRGNTRTADGAASNVYLQNDKYITLDIPRLLLHSGNVGVTKYGNGGVIVESGAWHGDEEYFFADEPGRVVKYDAGRLVIAVPSQYLVSNFDELRAAINSYYDAMESTVITVTADFNITETLFIPSNQNGAALTIRGVNPGITLTRGVTGNMFSLFGGGRFILRDIIIDGGGTGAYANNGGGSIVSLYFGAFIMNPGAVLRNNIHSASGGGVYVFNGTFTMTGDAIISGNTANTGGGVYVSNGTFTMTGDAIITGNTANNSGGGVSVSSGEFTMTGGTITGNFTNSVNGGGVMIQPNAVFNLGGDAVINGNTRTTDGAASNVFLSRGVFITLGTGGNGIAAPAQDMLIGVTKASDNGVIVNSGAREEYAAYFRSDEPGRDVTYWNNRLIITGGYDAPFEEFLQQVVSYGSASGNTTITVDHGFALTSPVTIPANAYDRTLTIRGVSAANPVVLTRGVAGTLLTVNSGARLILENIIIDGGGAGAYLNNSGSLVYVSGGEFVMNSGAVLRNNISGSDAGVSVRAETLMIDTDAGIYDCGRSAGGTFTMNGGEITGNIAELMGGAVIVDICSTFTMNGGAITDNTAGRGGGVYVYAGTFGANNLLVTGGTFTMTGGEISGNTANGFTSPFGDPVYYSSVGGGVYVDVGSFTMTGGEISGNIADTGGGVYVEDVSRKIIIFPGMSYADNEIILGGEAIIRGNLNDNVYLEDGQYIEIGVGASGPAGLMEVWVEKPGDDGVVVEYGAVSGDERYFHADKSGGRMVYEDGRLLMERNDASTPVIKIGRATVTRGKEVSVPVTISNNPGIVAMRLEVAFDSRWLTLESAPDSGLLGQNYNNLPSYGSPYSFFWMNIQEDDITEDGEIAVLNFKVSPDAPEGSYIVRMSYNTQYDIFDVQGNTVYFSLDHGVLNVIPFVYGDMTGNGVVAPSDLLILARYMARWPGVEINAPAADLDCDGMVTPFDLMVMGRHIARWPGYETLPVCRQTQTSSVMSFSASPFMSLSSAFTSASPAINVSSAYGEVGDIVDVYVSLSDNPGVIAMRLGIEYDETVLRLVDVMDNGNLGESYHRNVYSSPHTLLWANVASPVNFYANGEIVRLRFEILSETAGTSVAVRYDGVNWDVFDVDLNAVDFEVNNGIVSTYMPVDSVSPDLHIAGFTLVGSTRFGLAAYDYEFTAHVINNGGAAGNVTAILTGYQADIVTVIKGEIELGDIPSGGTAEGSFIIRIPINKNAAYDESQLEFMFYYTE